MTLIDGAEHGGVCRGEGHFLHGELGVKVAGITIAFLVIAEDKIITMTFFENCIYPSKGVGLRYFYHYKDCMEDEHDI